MMEFLKRILAAILRVLGLPDISDSEGVRKVVQKALQVLANLAKEIPTQIDDAIVAGFQATVDNDATWAAIHAWLMARLADEPATPPAGEAGELAAAILGVYGEESDD